MSRVRANNFVNKEGTGAPKLTYGAELPVGYGLTGAGGINITGVITATSSVISGTSTFNNVQVGGALTVTGNTVISGNLQVDGTQTILNTTSIEVEDINVGIASTASKLSNSQLDGAGITIYGSAGDKTLTWSNSNSRMQFNTNLYAPAFYGDGSQLTNVISGVELKQAGSSVGTGITQINFASGATLTTASSGISTVTIAVGLQTEAKSGGSVTLDLSAAQDHKVTATGITTITVTGGTEADSHTVRIVNSGIATVGFSTYFLFPSGAAPSLPTASGAISLISFTVHRVGAAGTQLLAGASVNFS